MISRLPVLLLLIALFSVAGCVSDQPEPDTGEAYYLKGLAEYTAGNYQAAEAAFEESAIWYFDQGLRDEGITSRNAMFRAFRTYAEFGLTEPMARDALREKVPGITETEIDPKLCSH
ncbi:hypothetical protein RJ53_11085, partial [Methanocalculus chunghsingensis]|nr:hypothetical protein [Methanocalculus chunghsingensis]